MDAKQAASQINNFPGFIASVPTDGHVQIRSIFFLGHITYYPKKGTLSIKDGVYNPGLESQLNRIKDKEGISVYALMCQINGHDTTDQVLKDQSKVKFLSNVRM